MTSFLVTEKYTVTTASTGSGAYRWVLERTKTGYTPIMYVTFSGYSYTHIYNAESVSFTDGQVSINGYSNRASTAITVLVLWKKNI